MADAIAPLRFDKALREPMEHLYAEHGEKVYEDGFLKSIEKDVLKWCEENDLSLNAKAKTKLLDTKNWVKLKTLVETATLLMDELGDAESDDFNTFKENVSAVIKAEKIKLSGPEKNTILNAVSWYDETAVKVIKKTVKLTPSKLKELLEHLGCAEHDLIDFGYEPTGKAGEFIQYEPCSDLRDSESVPLTDTIHRYFGAEVKPHVPEAWINLDSTKIGYEISFNKYFYRHKPLRSMEAVAAEIIDLEKKADGLIADILGLNAEGA